MSKFVKFMADYREFIYLILAVLLVVSIVTDAYADEVVVTYTPATEWSDGVPLAPGDIRSTRVYYGDPNSPDPFEYAGEPGADGQLVIADLPDGYWMLYGTHTAFTRDPNDDPVAFVESTRSNEVVTVIGVPVTITIGPPINVTIEAINP